MYWGTPARALTAILISSVAAACGTDASRPAADAAASSGSGGAAASSTVASSTTTSTAASSTGTAGQGGGNNDDCARATPVDFGQEVLDALETTGDADFFAFQGKKGQPLRIDAQSEYLDDTNNDPDHIDTVITLFDESGTQIAQNDDAIPYGNQDGVLLTMLPADGQYCARVADCWSVVKNPADHCRLPKDKTFTTYQFSALELDPANDYVVGDLEQGDDASSAVPLEYQLGNSGIYLTGYAFGTFADATDVDVFSFTLPVDTPILAGRRSKTHTRLIPSGPDFDGSTTPIGAAYVTTAADPAIRIAELEGTVGDEIAAPLELGVPHLLFVPRASAKLGTNDFYMLRYSTGEGNVVEVEEPGNDTVPGAEVMTQVVPFGQGGTSYYIEGDLPGGTDVDHFLFDVPAGMTTLDVVCSGANYGSGLVGLTATFMKTDGTPLPGASGAEVKGSHLQVLTAPPAGETQLVLQMSATAQSPTVTGAFYICGVHLAP